MASINFVTAHDGFTLHDLVSYNEKHNDANGEDNNDGESHNRSWNCGVEGPTDDAAVLDLRARQQRNFIATLLLSQGVPMLLHGDEMGRTQRGNNNVYCQDNEIAWMDWSLPTKNADLIAFTAGVCRAARRAPGVPAAAVLRRQADRPQPRHGRPHALPDIAWFTPSGEEMTEQDWDSGFGKCVTVFLNGHGIPEVDSRGERVTDDSFLLCFNAHYEDIEVTLPPPEYGTGWAIVVDTAVGEVLTLTTVPGVVAADPPRVPGGAKRRCRPSVVVLQRTETTTS